MRKILSLLSVVLATIFAVSCENTTTPESGVKFTFGEPKITSSSIELSVNCSDANVNYYAVLLESADIAAMNDAAIIESIITSGNAQLRKGFQIIGGQNLLANTDYTAVAFAYGATDELTKLELKTLEAQDVVPADQFNIEIEVNNITATSATAIATPNTTANRYYFRVITKMELDAFGIYNDDYQIFEYIIENPSSAEYITQGETTINCRLNAEMDYLAVAFNYENWEAMHNREDEIKLFRYAFSTPEAPEVDPNSLFTYSNLEVTHTGFSADVTPAQGEESFWGYYVWTKKSYDETLATESKASIVMRSYFGLNNIGVEQGYDFGTFIREYMGQTGSSTVVNYLPLHNNTDYVLVLFYMDPEVSDPTTVYDYNYVAVPFKTSEPSSDSVEMIVSEPIIESTGFAGYRISFNILVDETAVSLSKGANIWNSNIESYWDPTDWNSIRAFFWLYPVDEETLAQAKSDVGCVIAFTAESADDYVFFFEALNEEGTATQQVVRVTPDMYTNN